MGSSTKIHKHAPWRKVMLVPFWCIQLFFEFLTVIVLSLALNVTVNDSGDFEGTEEDQDVVHGNYWKTYNIVTAVDIVCAAICLLLTLAEIVLLARHKLRPTFFLVSNAIKSAFWTTIFVLDIVGATALYQDGVGVSFVTIIIDVILLLSFIIPLIYAIIIFRRVRHARYLPAPSDPNFQNPDALPYNTTYQPTYTPTPAYISPNDDGEPRTDGSGRRLSYNHQRDTRFEAFRQSSGYTGADKNAPYVAHGDEEMGAGSYEMSSRRDLR